MVDVTTTAYHKILSRIMEFYVAAQFARRAAMKPLNYKIKLCHYFIGHCICDYLNAETQVFH